jgi:hypothetical protein
MAEEDYSSLSLQDQLHHKVTHPLQPMRAPPLTRPAQSWKARQSAYTSLISLFAQTVSEADPVFREYPPSVPEWVKDANAVAQEKGLEAACKLIEFGGKQAARYVLLFLRVKGKEWGRSGWRGAGARWLMHEIAPLELDQMSFPRLLTSV